MGNRNVTTTDINDYWRYISPNQIVRPHTLPDPKSKKPENHTRFVCFSDTHSLETYFDIDNLPEADVMIHAGDFSNIGYEQDVVSFSEWLSKLPYKRKIVIAGNHDITFEESTYKSYNYERFHKRRGYNEPLDCGKIRSLLNNCTYLEDEQITLTEGFVIYGSPYQPEFGNWAFNLKRGEECLKKWSKIPQGVDILITHGPPVGHGDLCISGDRAGCGDLLKEVQGRIKPKYHVFGHIHEGYGVTTDGNIVYINASSCNVSYDPKNLNPPIVFDLPNPKSTGN